LTVSDSFLPDSEELTDEDREDARFLASRWDMNHAVAQQVRAASLNLLKVNAQRDPAHAGEYERVFNEIKQEALDAERSADRTLGIRGRVRIWSRSHAHGTPRAPLQRLSRLVRGVVASLSRLRSR
jgi:hypothetical protein